jgi:hypothetical protein
MTDNIEPSFKEEEIDGKKWYIVTIRDNGIGWSWDDMPTHVREKYLKSRKNIELLGGEFSYENIPYEGSKVTLKIPSCAVRNIDVLKGMSLNAIKRTQQQRTLNAMREL